MLQLGFKDEILALEEQEKLESETDEASKDNQDSQRKLALENDLENDENGDGDDDEVPDK